MSEDKLKITAGAIVIVSILVTVVFVVLWMTTDRWDHRSVPQHTTKMNCVCTSTKEIP